MSTSLNAESLVQVHQSSDRSFMPPCQVACPLHMEIREYVDLVAQGRIMEALKVIRNGNPFPAICANVCTHPCEEACRRGQVDSPIAIRALKKFAVEYGGDRMIQTETCTKYSEKVAIVGSGPAGLACAYYLRKTGYPVTVFELHTEIGGMLRVGIPRYRLPQYVLDIEGERLTRMGVEIRTNVRVVSLDLLFELGYKAIFVTVGAHQSLKMEIEGEESPGVIDGATFLREVNLGFRPYLGKKVGVVGGGNVAVDAARTAVRLGSEKVNILYRRSRNEMPADSVEIDMALEEGININFLVQPVKITRQNGKLIVTCIKMELGEADSSGRRQASPIKGSEFDEEYDSLITAIGQIPSLPSDFKIGTGRGSTIQVDPVTLTTNRPGVFAGGDAVTGPATVTEALSAGRLAAKRIVDFLQHKYPEREKDKEAITTPLLEETIVNIKKLARIDPPVLPAKDRMDFIQEELVYDWKSAINEARRCLRCGMGAEITSQDECASCLTCLRTCPYKIPQVNPEGIVEIPVDQCLACGLCVTECPARIISLRKPADYLDNVEEVLKNTRVINNNPLVIGFGCQYGIYGTGTLEKLWESKGRIQIIPVLCVAKIETEDILRSFIAGVAGVFIAGCGEYCAREKTAAIILKRTERVKNILKQSGINPVRLRTIFAGKDVDPAKELDKFIDDISRLLLTQAISREVKT